MDALHEKMDRDLRYIDILISEYDAHANSDGVTYDDAIRMADARSDLQFSAAYLSGRCAQHSREKRCRQASSVWGAFGVIHGAMQLMSLGRPVSPRATKF
jgi:hypothetical protein